jgi:hypothetical protein
MTGRLQLPEPNIHDAYLRRLVAELTRIVNDLNRRVAELESLQYVETDLSRPPQFDFARGTDGTDLYIGLNGAWVQVS